MDLFVHMKYNDCVHSTSHFFFSLPTIKITYLNSIDGLLQWLYTMLKVCTLLTTPPPPLLSIMQRMGRINYPAWGATQEADCTDLPWHFCKVFQMNYPGKNSQGMKKYL